MRPESENNKDWEKTLREETFDFPEATWQRMENDLRGFLASQARGTVPERPQTWRQKITGWMMRPAARWGVGLVGMALLITVFLGPRVLTAKPGGFAWVPGQVIESQGHREWDWRASRCRIFGDGARLRLRQATSNEIEIALERGVAKFQVDHRNPQEAFTVSVGECQVHVVGTTFTVGIDSLKQWVSVEEGKIRFQEPNGERMVGKGQSRICKEVIDGNRRTVVPDSLAGQAPTAPKPKFEPVSVSPAPIAEVIEVPSCQSGMDCIPQLAKFVRTYPNHVLAPEIALRWARLAAGKGDVRDALVAYRFASSQGKTSEIARLEVFELRVHQMGQAKEVVDSLDPWIASLGSGTATWRAALRLRQEVARRTGEIEVAKRLESQLQLMPQAQSGSR